MNEYGFSIAFTAGGDDDAVVDTLYGGAIDDALIIGGSGVFEAQFEREAVDLATAVLTAIRDIEAAPGCRVRRAGQDDLVTLAEVGRRINRTREYVRLLARGDRGPGGFPAPLSFISTNDAWSWQHVAAWLAEHDMAETTALADARVFRMVNAALDKRNAAHDIADPVLARRIDDALEPA